MELTFFDPTKFIQNGYHAILGKLGAKINEQQLMMFRIHVIILTFLAAVRKTIKIVDQLRYQPDQLSIQDSRYLNVIKGRRFLQIVGSWTITMIFTIVDGIIFNVNFSFPLAWTFTILVSILMEKMTILLLNLVQYPGIDMTSPSMILFLFDFEWWFAAFRWAILAWCLYLAWSILGHLIPDLGFFFQRT